MVASGATGEGSDQRVVGAYVEGRKTATQHCSRTSASSMPDDLGVAPLRFAADSRCRGFIDFNGDSGRMLVVEQRREDIFHHA